MNTVNTVDAVNDPLYVIRTAPSTVHWHGNDVVVSWYVGEVYRDPGTKELYGASQTTRQREARRYTRSEAMEVLKDMQILLDPDRQLRIVRLRSASQSNKPLFRLRLVRGTSSSSRTTKRRRGPHGRLVIVPRPASRR